MSMETTDFGPDMDTLPMDIKVKMECVEEEPFLASASGPTAARDHDKVGSCPKCGQSFKMRRFLLAHKLKCRASGTKKRYFYDSKSKSKSRSPASAVKKPTKTNNKLFACDLCPKSYRFKQNLQVHKQISHEIGSGATPSACPEPNCSKTFPNSFRLQSHLLLKHRLRESSINCPECGAKFLEEFNLAKHLRVNKCDSQAPLTCPACPGLGLTGTFDYKCAFKMHIENCTNLPLSHPCPFPNCLRAFTTRNRLSKHKSQCHPGPTSKAVTTPPPPPCHICTKQFPNRVSLKVHLKTHQPDEIRKKFVCPYCNRKFVTIAYLHNHEKFSRGESKDLIRPHCTQCSTTFSYKCQFKDHIFDQECPKCQLHFTCERYFRDHNCEGTPGPLPGGYPCLPCNKIYKAMKLWRIHSYTHLNKVLDTNVPCTVEGCGKSFRTVRYRNRHFNSIHSGKKWTCENGTCGKKFGHHSNFLKHTRSRVCYNRKGKRKQKMKVEAEEPEKALEAEAEEPEKAVKAEAAEPEKAVKTLKKSKRKHTPKPEPEVISVKPILLETPALSCSSCHQNYTRKSSLRRHLKTNQKAKKTKNLLHCEHCDRTFDMPCGLMAHHLKDKLTCSNPKCEFSTKCELGYTRHKESCIGVGISLVSFEKVIVKVEPPESIAAEDMDMDGEGPFYCWACDQLEFNLRSSFYNHIRLVHGQEPN